MIVTTDHIDVLRERIIPVLLLDRENMVKTVNFKNGKYIGDPINAVKIFNEKEVDEIAILDISATVQNRPPQMELIRDIASEAFMPLAYGGGVKTMDQASQLFQTGIEKVIFNAAAHEDPDLVRQAAGVYGSQSILVSMDVQKNWLGKYQVYTRNGKVGTKKDPETFAREMEALGVGELVLNSIDRDGTYAGYDLKLIRMVSAAVNIPVIACGGAGKVADLHAAIDQGGASAVAAGSMFVFHGKHRAVLINMPSPDELAREFYHKIQASG